jgi:hypothetical protein
VLFSQKSGVLNKAGRGVLRCVRGAAVWGLFVRWLCDWLREVSVGVTAAELALQVAKCEDDVCVYFFSRESLIFVCRKNVFFRKATLGRLRLYDDKM